MCKISKGATIRNRYNQVQHFKPFFVTLEAIIHNSSVSDGAIPASDQFGGSKADMPGYNLSAQCFKA